jgi:hypothetical protein
MEPRTFRGIEPRDFREKERTRDFKERSLGKDC